MVENTNHIDYFDGNEKITQNEYKKLRELAKNPSTLENLSKDQLQGLKNSLVSQLNGYKEREGVSDNSKKYVENLSNKIITKIDTLLSQKDTQAPNVETTPGVENVGGVKGRGVTTKEGNTDSDTLVTSEEKPAVTPVTPEQSKDAINLDEVVDSGLEQDPDMEVLEQLGVKPELLEGLTLSKIGQEHMKEVKKALEENKKEEAKRLAKDLLSDPKNFDDIVYEEYKQKYEKAIKELESSSVKVDGSKLEGIDNLEGSIISTLNDKIKNTKITIEQGGKNEEVSLSDYLSSFKGGVLLTFEDGKLTAKKESVDEKAISKLGDIIKDSLPSNISEKDVKFTLKFNDGFFSDSVEVVDIDAREGSESIESMVKDTIDLTKSEVFPKAPEKESDRKDNVVYINEIDDKKIYKVVVGEGETKIVKGDVLKTYLENSYNSQMESKKAELKAQNEKALKASKEKISHLTDSIEDLEVDENKANLEELGLIGLKIDGETPKVSKEGNKYTIDISGTDDLVVTKKGEKLSIRDEDNKLPSLEIKSDEDVVKYNELLQKYKSVNTDLNYNEEKLEKGEEAENNGDIVNQLSKEEKTRLIAENKIYTEFKKEVADITSIDQIDNVIKKMESRLEGLDKEEDAKEAFEKNLDKVEDALGDVSFNKEDLEHYYNGGLFNKDEQEAISDWLGNFDKKISIHSVSSKVDGDNVQLTFDFDDNWADEGFDKDITITVKKEEIKTLDKGRLSSFIQYNVIPEIAKLSKKGEDAWDDKSKKKFELK